MKVQFKNIAQINKFCRAVDKYDGKITIGDGEFEVDGSSLVGIMNLGLHRLLEVKISNKNSASAIQFMSEIAKLGIER